MESDDEMSAAVMEDSCDDEDFYDGGGDCNDDSDPDSVVISYDGLDNDSDDFDDLSSSHLSHYHRSQVSFVVSLNHYCLF